MTGGKRELDQARRKGILAELIAQQWLIEQGFWVFTPIGQHGPIDIIAVSKSGRTHFFDVKTLSRRKNGRTIARVKKDFQKMIDLQFLYVDIEKQAVYIAGTRSEANSRGFASKRPTKLMNI